MTTKKITARGDNYELEAFETPRGWAVVGYYGDLDIDSIMCEVFDLTFDEMDALVLEVIATA
jgi:hypothetical protein